MPALLPAAVALLLVVSPAARRPGVDHVRPPEVPDTGPRPDLPRVVAGILDQTEAFRKEQGRPPTTPNPQLTAAAERFAAFMAGTDLYGHQADTTQPAARAAAHGYDYCLVLENIAYAFNSQGFAADKLADTFAVGWQNSPGHRRNLLDPDVTETGVAVARSERTGHYYAVQLFGRPKAAAITFRISSRAGGEVKYTLDGQEFAMPPRVVRTHTLCRPAGLTVGETTLTPAAGNSLAVTRDGDRLTVAKE